MARVARAETAIPKSAVLEIEALRAEVAELRAMVDILADPEKRAAHDAKIAREKKSAANLEAGKRRADDWAKKHGPEPEPAPRKTREEAEAESAARYAKEGPRGLTVRHPAARFDRV